MKNHCELLGLRLELVGGAHDMSCNMSDWMACRVDGFDLCAYGTTWLFVVVGFWFFFCGKCSSARDLRAIGCQVLQWKCFL